jgi:nitrous-oxide reductase
MKPNPKYLLAMNKITKDRYLPTGPELAQAAQLIDLTGEKMEMFLDFPLIGEPHYAQAIEAEKIVKNSKKFYTLEENKHPHMISDESKMKVVRKGNIVDVYIAAVRSHFGPDNIEGIKVGDTVYFHVTNVEQDWDIFHGFSIMGANITELLIGPGETHTLKYEPKEVGVVPYYCTDFCSALHQEMQGYLRISSAGSTTPIKYTLGGEGPAK